MIRSRSFIPNNSSSPLNVPANASSQERDSLSSRLLCIFRQTPPVGGSKLWKYFLSVLIVGIIVYFIIAQSAPRTIRSKPSNRLNEKVTVVLNTFKRNSMMRGSFLFPSMFKFYSLAY
jgi:hypothetical protein